MNMNWFNILMGAFQAATTLAPTVEAAVGKVVTVAESPEVRSVILAFEDIFHISHLPNGGLVLTPKVATQAAPAKTA